MRGDGANGELKQIRRDIEMVVARGEPTATPPAISGPTDRQRLGKADDPVTDREVPGSLSAELRASVVAISGFDSSKPRSQVAHIRLGGMMLAVWPAPCQAVRHQLS